MTPDLRFDPPWVAKARTKLGTLEIPGIGSNPEVEAFHAVTLDGIAKDDIAWCSSFLCWSFEGVGIKSTRSKWSLSWKKWGIQIPGPLVGAVAVFDHGNDRGHVTLVVGRTADRKIVGLGGNQADSVRLSVYGYERLHSFRYPDVPLLDLAAPLMPESTR